MPPAGGCWPNWSPDGQSIAHVSLLQEPSKIQVVSSFGTDAAADAGRASRWHYYPDWSPDSRLLALSTSPEHHDGEDWDLAIARFVARRGRFSALTTGAGNDRLPDWRPGRYDKALKVKVDINDYGRNAAE